MTEVQDELDRGMLYTGTAVITPEMAFRDAFIAGRSVGKRSELERQLLTRATPARVLRLRLCLDEHGPHWLTLLCQCAWLRGGIVRVNSPPRLRPA